MRNPGYSKLKMQYIIAALIAVITILIIMLIVQAIHGQNYKPSYLVNGDIDINYGAALTYFEGTNGLIIVLGPNKLYSNVLMRAEELGIGVQRIVYVGLNLTLALNLVSSHPGSILILDVPYVEIKPNILGPLLAPYLKYGIIAFYNSRGQELQEYALNALYYAIELNWYIIYGTSPTSLSFNDQSYELWTPATEGVVCEPIVPS